jgi:hypothetical protein
MLPSLPTPHPYCQPPFSKRKQPPKFTLLSTTSFEPLLNKHLLRTPLFHPIRPFFCLHTLPSNNLTPPSYLVQESPPRQVSIATLENLWKSHGLAQFTPLNTIINTTLEASLEITSPNLLSLHSYLNHTPQQ